MFLKNVALALVVLGVLVLSAVAGEDIYNVSKETGMSSDVASIESGVRTPTSPGIGSMSNVAGDWTMSLNDAMGSKILRLTLYQNNDAVFGSGDITISGNTANISVGGTLNDNRLMLYVIPSGEPSLYKMDLVVGAGSLSGSYVFSKQSTARQMGTATGGLIESSTAIPITKNEVVTVQTSLGQTNADKPHGPKGTAV